LISPSAPLARNACHGRMLTSPALAAVPEGLVHRECCVRQMMRNCQFARGKKTGVRRRSRTPPTGLEVEGVSGGLQGQTGVLIGRGENLTCRVGTLLLMTAEELPSSWCFCADCDVIFSAGSGKLTILASQWHAQVKSPCHCVAKTASLPQQWAIIISQGSI
jgi:hypothetical protein